MNLLHGSAPIQVQLRGNLVTLDLNEELAINPGNIRDEIIHQPSKYAWWSVLSDLAERKVSMTVDNLQGLEEADEHAIQQYITACKQYELLSCTRRAFSHRKEALLELLENPNSNALQVYYNNLLNLRALLSA